MRSEWATTDDESCPSSGIPPPPQPATSDFNDNSDGDRLESGQQDAAGLPPPSQVSRELDTESNEDISGAIPEDAPDIEKPFRLFDLPQELQDTIFDYAYPAVPNLKIISRSKWKNREYSRSRYDKAHQTKPFPEPKVSEFLISRRYFHAAVKAWVGNQWIYDAALATGDYGIGLLLDCTRNLVVTFSAGLQITEYLQSLKRVKYLMSHHDFRDLAPRMAWEVLLDDEEIKSIPAYSWAIAMRGLMSFEAEATRHDVFGSEDESADKHLAANAKRFEELVKGHVYLPKETEDEENVTATEESDFGVAFNFKLVENLLLLNLINTEGERKAIDSSEIPDSDHEVLKMLAQDPASFLAWVQQAKSALAASEERRSAETEPQSQPSSSTINMKSKAKKSQRPRSAEEIQLEIDGMVAEYALGAQHKSQKVQGKFLTRQLLQGLYEALIRLLIPLIIWLARRMITGQMSKN